MSINEIKITRKVFTKSHTQLSERIKFYRNRYLEIYNLIVKSAKRRGLTVSSIVKQTREEQFLVIVRINEIKLNQKYTKLYMEQLYKDKSYYYEPLIKTESQLLSELFVGLIIGVILRQYNEHMYVVDLVWPHSGNKQLPKTRYSQRYILAVSDIHVASVYFNEQGFLNCINYVNNNLGIKYVVIAGDATEGINVYQNQIAGVTETSFESQYKKLFEYLDKFRKDVCIVLSPGNHDNYHGIAEPQQNIYQQYAKKFSNIISVPNPAYIQIEHLDYIIYHGRSQNSFLRNLTHISMQNCLPIQKIMLRGGHLSPILNDYSMCKITEEDSLLIKQIPHVLHLGHTHMALAQHEKGITYVNGGSFQFITPFQEKIGINPSTGSGVLINLGDYRLVEILDFNKMDH